MEDIDRQLAAAWQAINDPSFQPPSSNPVRVVHFPLDTKPTKPAVVLTDVLKRGKQKWIKPFLMGLNNRNNVLIDLESGKLTAWTLVDTAAQQTQGKVWFWELGGASLLDNSGPKPEFELVQKGNSMSPLKVGQFVFEPDEWEHNSGSVKLSTRLHFRSPDAKQGIVIRLVQTFSPIRRDAVSGLSRLAVPVGGTQRGVATGTD